MKRLLIFYVIFLAYPALAVANGVDSLEIVLQQSEKNDSVLVEIKSELAAKYLQSNLDTSLHLSIEALEIARKKNLRNIYKPYYLIGEVYYLKRQLDTAYFYYDSSLNVSTKIYDQIYIANNYKAIGKVFFASGSYELSLDYNFKSIEKCKNINDAGCLASCYQNIANIYYEKQKYHKALEYILRSMKFRRKSKKKNFYQLANSHISSAKIYLQISNFDLSYAHLDTALAIAKAQSFPELIANSYVTVGSVFFSKQKYGLAFEFYKKAHKKLKTNDYPESKSCIFYCLGQYYDSIQHDEKAIDYYLQALDVARKHKITTYVRKSAFGLSEIYRKLENYKNSYNYYVIYKQANDSLVSNNITRKIYLYEMEQKFQQRESKTKEKLEKIRNKNSYYFFGIISIGILFISIIIIMRFKSASNQQLKKQKAEIEKQRDEIEAQHKKMKELNATKDKFFSIVAHDLKNPFNTLTGFAQLLVRSYDLLSQEKVREFHKIILNSSKRGQELLINLLHWARQQTGNIEYTPEKIDVKDLVQTNISLLHSMAKRKEIKLTHQIECDANWAFADKNMAHTVLRNLITNAIKFTDKGGNVRVLVKKKNQMLEFNIKDSGVGIAPDDIEKLFRIDINTASIGGSKNQKGTGLGLILCKEFVETNGGKIWVESEYGKGSEFKFTLQATPSDSDNR